MQRMKWQIDSPVGQSVGNETLTSLEQVEKRILLEYLVKTNFNQRQASSLLGLGKNTLRVWMKKYGIRGRGNLPGDFSGEGIEEMQESDGLTPIERAKKDHLIQVLRRTNFNQAEASRSLGIRPNTLILWMRKYGIQAPAGLTRPGRKPKQREDRKGGGETKDAEGPIR